MSCRAGAVEALLAAGASTTAVTHAGRTALQLATAEGHDVIAALLCAAHYYGHNAVAALLAAAP
jgi:ankyrin repeat protein